MGDCLRTHGAAGMSSDIDAALRRMDTVEYAPITGSCTAGCLSNVDALSSTTNTSTDKTPALFHLPTLFLRCGRVEGGAVHTEHLTVPGF